MDEIKELHIRDMTKMIKAYLRKNLKINDFSIRSITHDEYIWKFKVKFKDKIDGIELPTIAHVRIDGTKGEIIEFKKYFWRFE